MSRPLSTRVLPGALLAAALALAPLAAQSPESRARQLAGRAAAAERAGELRGALALLSEAVQLAPGEPRYLLRREAVRSRLAQEHMDRAERLAVAGRLEEARAELRAALEADPAHPSARERLAQLAPRVEVQQPPPGTSLEGVRLQPAPGVRTFRHRAGVREAWEALGRAFNLTVSVDDGVRPRNILFHAEEVDFSTAARLLSDASGTFYRALGPRLIAVYEDNPANRRQFGEWTTRTLLLPESASPERMNEMLRVLREITGITQTQLDTRTRTLTLRDIPERVAVAAALVEQLEQGRAEVVLEVEILELDRAAARRLGLTPPASARTVTVTPQDIDEARQSTEALLRVLERLFGPLTPRAGAVDIGSLIPPLVAFGGGRSVFLATLPGAAAEFSDSLALVRRGRRMLLRGMDGEPATFFIGERYPINLAVLAPSLVGTPGPGGTAQSFDRLRLAVGREPAGVVAADFNADGRADLAVANFADNTVSILLNSEQGFEAAMEVAVEEGPVALAAADFNGDNILDLAVVNQTADSISILSGAGDGTFPARADLFIGLTPVGVVAGDFTGDNNADLVVALHGDDSVVLLPGLGDGTFGAPVVLATGPGPRGLAAADLNNNNRLDLLVTNEAADTLSIFLNAGGGLFAPRADFPTGARPVAVLAADFDRDGFRDVVVANRDDSTVSLLPGDGTGSFAARTDFSAGSRPVAAAARDFTGDGNLDLAIANEGSDDLTILLGDGAGGFLLRADIPAGDAPSALAAADLDGDARVDLAVAARGAGEVVVIFNQLVVAPGLGALQQPYPGFQYEDLGLKVRTTPRIHPGGDVTLHLEIEMRSLTGESFNDIPVISNRTLEQTVRLREGEPALVTGVFQQSDMRGVAGWPGLASMPAAGYLAGRREREQRESELVIVVTPRRVRLGPRGERLIYAGRDRAPAAPAAPARPQ